MQFSQGKCIFVAAALVVSTCASAGTESDYRALRSWCVQRNAHQNDAAWKAAHNDQRYMHFQHYCLAMISEGMLISPSSGQGKNALGSVLGETSYVISHVPDSHFLMPEVYAMRGRALFLGKRHAEAEKELNHALRLDPSHSGALGYLASLYIETNRKGKAVDLVRAGLALAPDNKRLRQLGKELKIDLPPEDSAPAAKIPEPESAGSPAESTPAVADSAPAVAEASTGKDVSSDEVIPDRGCRFCPPEEIQRKWRESFGNAPKQ